MEHTMKLYKDNFDSLKLGNKKREYRLNDEKRKLIKVGDTIKFLRLPNFDDEILTEVSQIETFDNWFDCYEKYFDVDFKDEYVDVEAVVKDTYDGYYTEEETKENGCVVFTLKKLQ